MKLAIAITEDQFCNHFGGSSHFAFYNVTEGSIEKLEALTPPPHQPGVLPQWLHEQGAKAVIAGGMGGRAITLLEQLGIQTVIGQRGESPDELARLFAAGKLQTTGETCAGHQVHGCDDH
ncbi:MAG: NifB/NifX family molybdenum-iron cluster-binding protein [Candidatus Cloacimonetes bacterium]|nr:NifB/NifX family molybdenum-iron cluster-binding protein [Candidatus Cloacimonadota bacterium]